MNWEEQLKTVKRKIKNGLGAMFKLKNILSQKQLATVYRALIESHLRYCSVIWGCLSNTKLESLQRLQNRARRLIECARHKGGWVCDWLDLRNLIKYDRLITTYQINNGLCPENLKNKFTPRSIFRLRLEYCKKSFGYQRASAWNEIPKQIRNLKFTKLQTLEIYKTLHNLNPAFMKNYFLPKPPSYNFRRNDVLSIPKVKTTNYGIKSISFLGPKIWNSLPNEVKSSEMQISSKLS